MRIAPNLGLHAILPQSMPNRQRITTKNDVHKPIFMRKTHPQTDALCQKPCSNKYTYFNVHVGRLWDHTNNI